MQGKKEKFGNYRARSVIKYFWFFLILFISSFYCPTYGQNTTTQSLKEALLKLAKSEKLSIVFSTSNFPRKNVSPLPQGRTVKDRLTHLLEDTDMYFRLKEGQIFLFKKYKIFGYIEDHETSERLISATLFSSESGEYEVSNAYGYYSVSAISDTLNLEVSYVGYKTRKIQLSSEEMNRVFNISLEQDNSIAGVLITDNLVSKDDRKYIELDKGSDILLTQNQAITALGGEPDLFQTLVRQSGVSSGADGIGGIHIRGGKNDQNLILYDGVKLYNSAHAFGLFSLASSSVVDQIRLHKSGAAGSTSGRLSSVVDVKIKDPDLKTTNGSLQFSTLAGQATVEVPLIKNRLGLLISGRRTYIDPYINHITDKKINDIDIDGESGYNFYDVNLKLYGKIDNKNRLYFSLYQGRDNYSDVYNANLLDFEPPYYLDQDINYNWKNRLASIRWNRLLGKSSFINFQVSGYQYDYRNLFDVDEFDAYYDENPSFSQYSAFNAQTTNYEVKVDVETVLDKHHLKYGVNASSKSYQIGETVDTILLSDVFMELDINQLNPSKYLGYSNEEVTVYLSDKLKISDQWMIEGGIYQTIHRTKDDGFALESLYGTSGYLKTLNKINNDIYIGGSIGSYIQTEHLLTTADNGYPNDIWVPSTDIVPFQRSNQLEVFAEIELEKHTIRLSSYYKKQTGILRNPYDAELPGLADLLSESWEADVLLGEADGYGLELDYSYKLADKISFRGVYSYGIMEYQFESINNGNSFPFDYSIPHTFSFGGNIKIKSNWRLVIDWFYSSGKPYTLYESGIEYSPLDLNGLPDEFALSNENALRLPDIHKLSVMLSTKWKWSTVRNNFSLGVQNLYNRKNVILQYELAGEGIQSQRSFPLLPMLLWRISF